MKKITIPQAAALVLPLLFAAPAGAQTSASGGGNARLEIQPASALTITVGEINFGVYAASEQSHLISLNCQHGFQPSAPALVITAGACAVISVANNSASAINALFSVTHSALVSGNNSVPEGSVTLYLYESGEAGSIVFGNAQQTLAANATAQYNLGGVLTVGANQAPGNYGGTYTFTATIQ